MDVNSKDNDIKIKKKENGRELFYGVIAIASFIVMAVGATFAYFTATASSADSSITTGSTTLELEYISFNSAWMKDDLIPANTAVVEYSVENQNDSTRNRLCVDDYGNSICSVYQFKVVNNANSPQVVSLDIVSEKNEFASLNAMAYEVFVVDDPENNDSDDKFIYDSADKSFDPIFKNSVDDGTEGAIEITNGDGTPVYDQEPIYVNREGVTKKLLNYNEAPDNVKPSIDRLVVPVNEDNIGAEASAKTVRVADNIEINGKNEDGNPNYKNFIIVLYIRNSDVDQTKTDADKTFTGKVVVSNGDGGTGVSGTISAIVTDEKGNINDDLQSGLKENLPGVTQP